MGGQKAINAMTSIKNTTDYGQFKTMGGNRVVDHNHVEGLRQAMVANPEWFATQPAVVNENGFIIDGQHRWKAAQLAELPFYFIQVKGLGLEAAREMNIRQKKWTLQDYAKSFADSGREDYKKILELQKKYPRLSLGVLIVACTGNHDYSLTRQFKAGTFTIDDVELAEERAEMLSTITSKTSRYVPVPFARVFIKVLKSEEFDDKRFFDKLEVKPEALVPGGMAKDNYRTIEDVYNYHAIKPTRLY